MTMGEDGRSLNPAASRSRMYIALAILLVLGLLSWFMIDASSVIHVRGYSSRFVSYDDRDVQLRWMPILFLGLFAFRVVIANMRARLEEQKSKER
ncbi:MAG TPA: hypothetical protein VIJ79_14885 [Acidobacteriaceae bacterium]